MPCVPAAQLHMINAQSFYWHNVRISKIWPRILVIFQFEKHKNIPDGTKVAGTDPMELENLESSALLEGDGRTPIDLIIVTPFVLLDTPADWDPQWDVIEMGLGRVGVVLWDWFTTKESTEEDLGIGAWTGDRVDVALGVTGGAFPASNIIAWA